MSSEVVRFLGYGLAGAIRYSLYILEGVAVLVLVRQAIHQPQAGREWLCHLRRALGRLARRRGLAAASIGLSALAIRAALLPILPPRAPAIGDELSYVLAGETFALGRLTNPPHPMWMYFESPHILQQPTYMSMYFPMQGLFLAAGKIVAGHAWFGVWFSAGLMCAAICWMLQGWLPPGWALLGGAIAVMRYGLFGYWMNSYFGGAIPALGGALVLGALPRIMRIPRITDAVALAVGLSVLLNSRPYEGLLLAMPVAVTLAVTAAGKRRQARVFICRVILPAALVLAVTLPATCYYYWRVTGDPFRMPEQFDNEVYAMATLFIWQSPRPEPVYHHAGLRGYYAGAQMDYFRKTQSLSGWLETSLMKIRDFWLFYLGPILTLPLIALPWVLKDRRIRVLLVVGGVFLAGLSLNRWFYPHYAAPAAGLILAVLLQSMRHLRVWKWRGRPVGSVLVAGVPVVCLGMVMLRVAAQPLARYMPTDFPMTWYSTRPGGLYREAVLAKLRAQPGNHLVFVRWVAGDNPFEQWVYNEPDIDQASVVWSWEMDPAANQRLIRYYRDRHVWLLHPQWFTAPRLSPYSGSPAP